MNTAAIIADIKAALAKAVWVPDLHEVGKAAPVIGFKAYRGYANGWEFLVAGFDVPDERKRAYDGTATRGGLIVHLPPDLAKQAGEEAEASP
jgi:hypothetical protein